MRNRLDIQESLRANGNGWSYNDPHKPQDEVAQEQLDNANRWIDRSNVEATDQFSASPEDMNNRLGALLNGLRGN